MALGASLVLSSSSDLSQASLTSSSSSSPSHLSDGFEGASFFASPGSKSSASEVRIRISIQIFSLTGTPFTVVIIWLQRQLS